MKAFKYADFAAIIKIAVLILAISFCLYGTLRGEADAVLRKAAAICLECCGIG